MQEIYIITALIVLLIATYTDWKTRLVSNKLTFGATALGLTMHAYESFITIDPTSILLSLQGGIIGFTFGYILYKVGVWAGGDVKLLTAIGTLTPLTPILVENAPALNLPIFPITFTIYSALAILPYTLLLVAKETIKRKELRTKPLKQLHKKTPGILFITALISGLNGIFAQQGINLIWVLPVFLGIILLKNKLKLDKHIHALTIILLAYALILNFNTTLYAFEILFASTVLISLVWIYIPLIRTEILQHNLKISKLEEGEISAELIYLLKGKIHREKTSLKNMAKSMQLERNKAVTLLASPFQAAGITEENVKKLKLLVKHKKMKNIIRIQKSIPFVPVFTLGYIASMIIGDVIWFLA